MARLVDHAQLLESAQRESAEIRVAWLRGHILGSLATRPSTQSALTSLLGPEGQESLEQALREHRYSADELRWLPRQLGQLAREGVLHEGRHQLARWLATRLPVGSEARTPTELLASLADPRHSTHSPNALLRALDSAFAPHTEYLVDLYQRAEHAASSQRIPVTRSTDSATPASPPERKIAQDPNAPAAATERPSLSPVERANQWLSRTDDAARELAAWLSKRTSERGETGLGTLFTGLRASQLDGLATPQRRLFRLAEGARRLGFERDMSARMRAETSETWLIPAASCLALAVPSDVRVVQSFSEFGVLSDLAAAQGIGEALALCLVSPTLSPLLSRPVGSTVSAGFGGLFLQLRADPGYLRRVEGIDKSHAAPLGRHAALWVLLRARLAAALYCAEQLPARSAAERVSHWASAGERALGYELPPGLAALAFVSATAPQRDFEALADGCELHAALRERYDVDFYVNPRVSEVLRGAAQRGNTLSPADLGAELRTDTGAGIARMLELIG
jgi:hypothetical protein